MVVVPWSPRTMTLAQRCRFICFRPFISWPMMLSISLRGLSSYKRGKNRMKEKWLRYFRKCNDVMKHKPCHQWQTYRFHSPHCWAVPVDVQRYRAALSGQHKRTACRKMTHSLIMILPERSVRCESILRSHYDVEMLSWACCCFRLWPSHLNWHRAEKHESNLLPHYTYQLVTPSLATE